MRKTSKNWLALLASLTVAASTCWAQLPAAPTTAAAVPAASPSGNLWSFLLPNAQQKAACKTCFCNSAIGQMMSGGFGPVSAMSGGLFQNRCMQNSLANDALQGAGSPTGLAAIVKKDEEDAKVRRANIRFLGTVDCDRWPEAIDVLIKGLRGDKNECVRFEAALALQRGCCCKPKVIDALKNCVLGDGAGDLDFFPAEHSQRVRAAAADALTKCVVVSEVPEAPKVEGEKPRTQAPTNPEEYYKQLAKLPREDLLKSAREALKQSQDPKTPVAVAPPRAGNLTDIVKNAFGGPSAVQTSPPPGSNVSGGTTVASGTPVRQPFFSNLTKALTGRQDGVVAQPENKNVYVRDNDKVMPPPFPGVDPAPATIPVPVSQPIPVSQDAGSWSYPPGSVPGAPSDPGPRLGVPGAAAGRPAIGPPQ